MRLAATEIGLEFNDRIAALTGEPEHCSGKQVAQTMGQVGAPEKFDGVAVFIRTFAHVNLPQVRRELGLLIFARSDIFVGRDNFAPRF